MQEVCNICREFERDFIKMKQFKNPIDFPYEGFIQKSIEAYFEQAGYYIEKDGQVDLIATKGSEKWIIEAKGITSAIGTDFNTCLGQLIKSMTSDQNKYAIAIPKHPKYKHQCDLLSDYFRQLVKLHILVVDSTGDVKIIEPLQEIGNFKDMYLSLFG